MTYAVSSGARSPPQSSPPSAALGSEARARSQTALAIGRDGRLSGPELSGALAQGLCAAGVDVIDIGMAATPMGYFAAHHLGCGSVVMVTGSHNPPDYNGLKMVLGGVTLALDDIQRLRARIEAGDFRRALEAARRPMCVKLISRASHPTSSSRGPCASSSTAAMAWPARARPSCSAAWAAR